ncbi:hypothetical protein IAR55_005717 [Kwoniella newhampshirensis]|uniref:MARVEL domain-containing protein n=1 Tax=Kwoniella newhampshirensis TaxID=1651941 RepID=A0AAW0YV98_9TREE
MSIISPLATSLKVFAAFWALCTLGISAGFIGRVNYDFGTYIVNNSNLAAGIALIAASTLALPYFLTVLFIQFTRPEHGLISTMLDTISLGVLFIFFLGATAALSRLQSIFTEYDRYIFAKLGSTTVGAGWAMTGIILAILLLEVIYTLKHFGGSHSVWRTPFNQLVRNGHSNTRVTSVSSKRGAGGTPASEPMSMSRAPTAGHISVPAPRQGSASQQN